MFLHLMSKFSFVFICFQDATDNTLVFQSSAYTNQCHQLNETVYVCNQVTCILLWQLLGCFRDFLISVLFSVTGTLILHYSYLSCLLQ